jgi:Protein of unknown function (DUF1559)
MTSNARAWLAYLLIIIGTWFYFGPLAIEVAFITLWAAMLIWQTRYDWRMPVPKPVRISKIVFMWCMMSILGVLLFSFVSLISLMFLTNANKESTADRMYNIVLAMKRYDEKTGKMPANSTKDGKPLLSWRVHLLPYLGLEKLYQQFRLDEPWDSPHNLTLLPHIPDCYQLPKYSRSLPMGHTLYQVFASTGALMENGKQHSLAALRAADGLEHTMLLTLSKQPIPWTKPEDIETHVRKISELSAVPPVHIVSIANPLPERREPPQHQPHLVVTANGSCHRLYHWQNDAELTPFITWNGGEKVKWEFED